MLVATVLLVSVTASANLLRNSHEQFRATRGSDLATIFLDEITTRRFADADANATFGIEPDELNSDRTTFDDVDDYHNYSSATPTYRDGSTIDGFTGWSVSVAIERADVDGNGIVLSGNSDSPLRLATVNCTSPESITFSKSILVSSVPNDIDASTSYEEYRRVRFAFGSGRSVSVVVPLKNQPEVTN
tara:strand:- start:108811 stop:109374 length:564 start_codon:yes stop_codon:yes gene_type:complete